MYKEFTNECTMLLTPSVVTMAVANNKHTKIASVLMLRYNNNFPEGKT